MMKKKGAAFLLALFTLVIVSLLVGALLEVTTTDLQIISNQKVSARAYYIACAGIEYLISRLRSGAGCGAPATIVFPAGSGDCYMAQCFGTGNTRNLKSMGLLASGQACEIAAKITLSGASAPYTAKIVWWGE